jgi:hypothetical protein
MQCHSFGDEVPWARALSRAWTSATIQDW